MAIADIITTDYFINEISIPVEAKDGNRISAYITNVQDDVLRDLLGDELFLKISNDEYTDFWTKLKDGSQYYIGNERVDYRGLKGNATNKRDSLLAYFTYYEYVKDDHYTYSRGGVTSKLSVNQQNTSPLPLMARAYNAGVDLYGGLRGIMKPYDRSAYAFIVNGDYENKNEIMGKWHFTPRHKIPALAI